MKTILFACFFVLISCAVLANPFLVCDEPAGAAPEWYELEGLDWLMGQHPAEPDGTMRIDLVDTPPGVQYTVRARACNIWGCSGWSASLNFTRATEACGIPAGLRIEE